MPFNAFATHRPSCKAYHKRNANPWLTMASDSRRATDECGVQLNKRTKTAIDGDDHEIVRFGVNRTKVRKVSQDFSIISHINRLCNW
jgi:hypothetical protein